MPNSTLRPFHMWPANWTTGLLTLALNRTAEIRLHYADKSSYLTSPHRRAQAMAKSIEHLPGWPPIITALLQSRELRFARRKQAGVWVLCMYTVPRTEPSEKIMLAALQNTDSGVDSGGESLDDSASPAPDTAHRQAP